MSKTKPKAAKPQQFIIVATWTDVRAELITVFDGTKKELAAFLQGYKQAQFDDEDGHRMSGEPMTIEDAMANGYLIPGTNAEAE